MTENQVVREHEQFFKSNSYEQTQTQLQCDRIVEIGGEQIFNSLVGTKTECDDKKVDADPSVRLWWW
jgi:hypothetical protein